MMTCYGQAVSMRRSMQAICSVPGEDGRRMKKNPRFYFALFMGKLAYRVQRMLRMNATFFPGKLAIRLCPDFIGRIGKPEKIVAVTGTNGKTTCCNMLIDILTENGYDLMNNRAGSNTDAGIATALLRYASIGGKARKPLGILEIDERSSKRIYPYICPTYVVCTNLFRDSIQRNAHPEYIADIITSAVPKTTKMILNADDPISSRLAPDNDRVYFAIRQLPTDKQECTNIINDCRICPRCSTKLLFRYNRYHHIGNVYCPNCDYTSPTPDYPADVDMEAGCVKMELHGRCEEFTLVSNSIFNIYNQVTATAVLTELGLTPDMIRRGFGKLSIVETRYSHAEVGGLSVITHMAKGHNPIACSCVFDYAVHEPGVKEIILMPDDDRNHLTTSENITWAYDADFEKLADESIARVVVGGIRAEDYRLRLLIAGVEPDRIFTTPDERDTPKLLKLDGTDKVFILHQLYKTEAARIAKEDILKEVAANEESH